MTRRAGPATAAGRARLRRVDRRHAARRDRRHRPVRERRQARPHRRLPASSGRTTRHRLDRGGNRQLNPRCTASVHEDGSRPHCLASRPGTRGSRCLAARQARYGHLAARAPSRAHGRSALARNGLPQLEGPQVPARSRSRPGAGDASIRPSARLRQPPARGPRLDTADGGGAHGTFRGGPVDNVRPRHRGTRRAAAPVLRGRGRRGPVGARAGRYGVTAVPPGRPHQSDPVKKGVTLNHAAKPSRRPESNRRPLHYE